MNKIRNVIITVLIGALITLISNIIDYKINGENRNFLSLLLITVCITIVVFVIFIISLIVINKSKNKRK
jgi:amino acid transporter